MKLTTSAIFSVTLALMATQAQAGMVLVDEDFDSYADTAAMTAVWTGGPATLSTAQAFSGSQSAMHPGGVVNNYAAGFGSVTPSATEDLVLSARIYDDALGASDRNTVGLRTGTAPLFEMGHYNGPSPYAIRGLTLGNGIVSPGYVSFKDGGGAELPTTRGWHTYEATFSLTEGLTVTLDLNSDGTIDSTLSFVGNGSAFNNFSDLRFGGPSNVSSAGPIFVDDIHLALVDNTPIPEPTTLALAGLAIVAAGLGLRRR